MDISNASDSVLFSSNLVFIAIPDILHIDPAEGGHLIVAPLRDAGERADLNDAELLEIQKISILASRALREVIGADWINYQENGNYAAYKNKPNKMHVHVYGRKKGSTKQPYGEPIQLPFIKDIPHWDADRFTLSQIDGLREFMRANYYMDKTCSNL